MTRARPSLLPLLAIVPLAVAACQTLRKPLTGFDMQPPGSIVLGDWHLESSVMIWPIFDLPQTSQAPFRARLNGQDVVVDLSDDPPSYDYARLYLQGWTGGWPQTLGGISPGTYVVELVDGAGHSWGQSAPLAVPALADVPKPVQSPAVIFANFDGQIGSWNVDTTMQDSDPATDEITVTNLVDEDVVVERCLIVAAVRTSCTPVGTVAPGADLVTVETLAVSSKGDHQGLFIHLPNDANQSYQRDLVQGAGTFGDSCQIERIIVHGTRPPDPLAGPSLGTALAMSSCYGYASGAGM